MRTTPAWRPEIKTIRTAKSGARASAESTQRFSSMKLTPGDSQTCAGGGSILEAAESGRGGAGASGGLFDAASGGGWAAGRGPCGGGRDEQPGQELGGRNGHTAEVDVSELESGVSRVTRESTELRKVPFEDPRSSINASDPATIINRAWRLETRRSSRMMSLPSTRPMRTNFTRSGGHGIGMVWPIVISWLGVMWVAAVMRLPST